MNEIIKVNEETKTVSGRDLHEALQIKTPYTTWFSRVCDYGFVPNVDYTTDSNSVISENGVKMPQERVDHILTFDMAKQVCMIQKSEIGMKVRQYFLDLEKAWNTPEQIMARALRIADQTIANLYKQLEEQKPLVEFADRVSQSSDTVDMAEMAKLVKDEGIEIGRNRLINWMKEQKYLLNNNTPYQKYVDAGYMKVVDVPKDTPYGTRSFTKTVFTGKGQIWIVEKLRDNYKVKK